MPDIRISWGISASFYPYFVPVGGLQPAHTKYQRDYHNDPDDRLRYNDAPVADGRHKEGTDEYFSDKLKRTGKYGGFRVAEALHTVAEQADYGGDEIQRSVYPQIQRCRVNDRRCIGGGYQGDNGG